MKKLQVFLFLILLICNSISAQTTYRYVNSDNVGTVDGLTLASGYTYLGSALNALDNASYPGDLVIYCSGDVNDGTVAYELRSENWTGLTGNLIIAGNPNELNGAHSGVNDATKYHISINSGTYIIRNRNMTNLILRNIIIQNTNTTATAATLQCTYNSVTTIEGCVLMSVGDGMTIRLAVDVGYTATLNVYSSLFYRNGTLVSIANEGIYIESTGNINVNVINCVFTNYDAALECVATGTSNIIVRNSAFLNNNDDILATTGTWTIDRCASDDGDGTNSIQPADWNACFVDTALHNYHISPISNALTEAGSNLYATFQLDIDRDPWPSSGAWNVGFDANESSEPQICSLFVSHNGNGSVNPLGMVGDTCNDSIEISATATSGYRFVSWTGRNAADNYSAITKTTIGNDSIYANFEEIELCTLTVLSNLGDYDTTYIDTCGNVLTIIAPNINGKYFSNWLNLGVSDRYNDTTTITAQNDTIFAIYVKASIVFLHHSTGGNWQADTAGGTTTKGNMAHELQNLGYYYRDVNYTAYNSSFSPKSNSNISDSTDIGNWYTWFSDSTNEDGDGIYRRDNIMGAVDTTQSTSSYHGTWQSFNQRPSTEHDIIMFKSCYPNSEVQDSNVNDYLTLRGRFYDYTVGGQLVHTLPNIKRLYQDILNYFKSRPDKMFMLIVNPPRVESATNETEATNMRTLANWLVFNWLQDAGWENKNVYVFDFYNVLTGPDNHHRLENGIPVHTIGAASTNVAYYPTNSGDSHPDGTGNRKATEEFVPLFDYYFESWQEFLISDTTDIIDTNIVYVGDTLHISWSAQDLLDTSGDTLMVSIQLSRDNKQSWEDIGSTTDTFYNWVTTGTESNDSCYIRLFVEGYDVDTVTSSMFNITLIKTIASIIIQPENATVDIGQTAAFTITASGTNLSYVVYRNSDSVGNTNSYSFTTVLDDNGDSIWWKVQADTGNAVYSDTVQLSVLQAAVIDSIRPRTWYRGKQFSVYASGTNNPQGTGQLYFSTLKETASDSLGVTSLWSSTLINDTIPSNALSRWYYVWFKNSLGLTSNIDSIRVYIPKVW